MDKRAEELLKYLREGIGKCKVLMDNSSGSDYRVAVGQLDIITDITAKVVYLFKDEE